MTCKDLEKRHLGAKKTTDDGFDLIMQDGKRANDYLSSLPPQSESDAAESKVARSNAAERTKHVKRRADSDHDGKCVQKEQNGPKKLQYQDKYV